ncbi:unnamed protein product [Caenorhabditis auriculariae]|uniref:Uncharacterized protein n=1 Tax=Caenorhabditis auriculariae TaxID=2777116 RepID=A0A8S1H1D4_9PELO|nr:unnamed protein product [Caenorhabditis auriculariae]
MHENTKVESLKPCMNGSTVKKDRRCIRAFGSLERTIDVESGCMIITKIQVEPLYNCDQVKIQISNLTRKTFNFSNISRTSAQRMTMANGLWWQTSSSPSGNEPKKKWEKGRRPDATSGHSEVSLIGDDRHCGLAFVRFTHSASLTSSRHPLRTPLPFRTITVHCFFSSFYYLSSGFPRLSGLYGNKQRMHNAINHLPTVIVL